MVERAETALTAASLVAGTVLACVVAKIATESASKRAVPATGLPPVGRRDAKIAFRNVGGRLAAFRSTKPGEFTVNPAARPTLGRDADSDTLAASHCANSKARCSAASRVAAVMICARNDSKEGIADLR